MSISKDRFAAPARVFCAFFLLLSAISLHAGIIRGTITDTSGATVTGAAIVLMNGANYVGKTVSTADGSYQFVTGQSGRFSLSITAGGFRQLQPAAFYAGRGDNVERNLVLEPEWVHQSIVVTATGTPVPQQQTSAAITVLGSIDLAQHDNFTDALRQMPGTVVTQSGQVGAQTSLFIRGGPSDGNKVLLDGVSIGDLGGRFDFGPLATTGIDSVEILEQAFEAIHSFRALSGPEVQKLLAKIGDRRRPR